MMLLEDRWWCRWEEEGRVLVPPTLAAPGAGKGTVGATEEPPDLGCGTPRLLPVTLSVQLFTLVPAVPAVPLVPLGVWDPCPWRRWLLLLAATEGAGGTAAPSLGAVLALLATAVGRWWWWEDDDDDPAWGKSSGRPVNRPVLSPLASVLGTKGGATGSRDNVDGRALEPAAPAEEWLVRVALEAVDAAAAAAAAAAMEVPAVEALALSFAGVLPGSPSLWPCASSSSSSSSSLESSSSSSSSSSSWLPDRRA